MKLNPKLIIVLILFFIIILFFFLMKTSLFNKRYSQTSNIKTYDGASLEAHEYHSDEHGDDEKKSFFSRVGKDSKDTYKWTIKEKKYIRETYHTPIIINEFENTVYIVELDKKTDIYCSEFRFYKFKDNNWVEINYTEFPKFLSIQNLNFDDNEKDIINQLDTEDHYFRHYSLTGRLWILLETGKQYYETEYDFGYPSSFFAEYKDKYIKRESSLADSKDYVEEYKEMNMKMIWIEGGTFQMGSPDSKKYRISNEGPVHDVTLDGFWIGETEVTQYQWETLMGNNPSHYKGRNLPVENVSWGDALEFCKKLSENTDKKYTLPTEAQWEYSCRAGSKTMWFFGEDESLMGEYAWINYNAGEPHPVKIKKPNAYHLYDMYGNVDEWCLDWNDDRFYEKKESRLRNPVNNIPGTYRIIKGGCYMSSSGMIRSAARDYREPNASLIGFRVCRIP